MRRAAYEGFNGMSRDVEFHPTQTKEAVLLADGLLRNDGCWEGELRRAAASTILSIVYDIQTVSSPDDPTVTNINWFGEMLVDYTSPGKYLVEFFPWMLYIPSSLAKWKREARETYHYLTELFERMVHDVEHQIEQGDERPSFAGNLLRERDRNDLSDSELAWLSASMYLGGSETTAKTMTWFLLAMIAYPEKQRKCQEELERVIGRSRMPTLADQTNLPYIRATIRELLRWRPVTPLGIMHYSMEDDWYEGYFIPKGTTCIANVWSLNRDRAVYGEDADDFNPDRFIDNDGQLSPPLPDTKNEGHVTFGFGPRICLGRRMANASLFINIASILWSASVSPMMDEAGKPIIPDTLETVNSGVVVRPLPFDCVITPRFPEAKAIVARTRELL